MEKVKITLELSYKQVAEVMALLHNTSSDLTSHPVTNNLSKEDVRPSEVESNALPTSKAHTVPTATKHTIMPVFGRSQKQIDAYTKSEALRIDKANKKAISKTERKKEREIKEAEKNKKALDKQQLLDKEISIVEDIKSATQTTTVSLPNKPWEL